MEEINWGGSSSYDQNNGDFAASTGAVSSSNSFGNTTQEDSNEELEAMKRKVKEMHDEAERLEQIQKQVEEQMTSSPTNPAAVRNSQEVDKRSIYIGNVDYGATPEELQAHFQSCGTINRVTILCDKMTGHPKGFAYIEFIEEESVANAMILNEELFRNRPLKILPKRTNYPGFGRGFSTRGRGTPNPYSYPGYGFRPGPRVFRGRPRRPAFFHPYYS